MPSSLRLPPAKLRRVRMTRILETRFFDEGRHSRKKRTGRACLPQAGAGKLKPGAYKVEKNNLADGGFGLVEGVVGGANQGAGFHVPETHLFTCAFEFGELVRVDEADNR